MIPNKFYVVVSILVLVEIRNQIEKSYLQTLNPLVFQSLFWWKSEIKFWVSPVLYTISSCFNPCFGGNQKSNLPTKRYWLMARFVSILVLVEIRNQIEGGVPNVIFATYVSILVLVEIRNQIIRLSRFFPWIAWVSILVLVEIRNQIFFLIPGYSFIGKFQSLFWWKSEIKFLDRRERGWSYRVSILVLVEIRNQITISRSPPAYIEEFQSLFWWKSEIKFKLPTEVVCLRLSFQSLFWWKSEIK